MTKEASALHLVERPPYENRKLMDQTLKKWETGYWRVGNRTAKQLIGRKIYLYDGQKANCSIGGEILAWIPRLDKGANRKIFLFREIKALRGVPAPQAGWGNEKCISWKN
ncbi:hypothetical protein [Comamonas sp.]|uniref:hypothetical protein n=1 Tax=Comamonas sp. TaxID=34028 RepID=UPI0012C1FBB3|nr:hypothetical protein [Comamonas sp.]MPS93827.1 hypothetical protein [Comamonas sp.]